MGLEELLGLPATVNVVTAARALGISRNKAYALINSGEFPVKTLTLGNQVRVPTVAL
ncbi:helix-turn-helix domain-containing protein [Streptomyces lunaelactis]|nr:helix-turn-helix domain-containing protein [Streptomyces lunaelactis]